MNCLKQIIICFLFIAVSFGCQKHDTKETSSKKVIASVNDTIITVEEFQEVLKRLLSDSASLPNSMSNKEDLLELKKNILAQIIEEELILDEAKKMSITSSEAEVSKEIEGIKKDYKDDAFKDTIVNRYGSMEKWRDEIRKKLLIKKTIDLAAASKVSLTDGDLISYYKEHKAEFRVPEKVKMRMIILSTEDEAGKTLRRLRKGEDFTKVAKEVSLDKDNPNAGEFAYYSRGDLPKEFEDVVFSITLARASEVVKTSYGYNIFRVDEKTKARDSSFQEVKGVIAERLKRERGDKAFQEWLFNLKQKAKIEIEEELL